MKKKFASLLMAAVMTMSLAIPAFAAGNEPQEPTQPTTSNYSITVKRTSERVSLKGNIYKAYKVFDLVMNAETAADANAFYYTVAPAFEEFSFENKTGEDLVTYIGTQTDNSDKMNEFAEEVLKFIESKENTDKPIADNGSVTATADDQAVIPVTGGNGYYLVAGQVTSADGQQVVAACSLDTVAPNQEVNVKADAPTLDKVIVDDNGENPTKANNASIGDVVNFKITSTVPRMTGYDKYYFIVTDTLSKGLTLNEGKLNELDEDVTFVVKVGDKTLKAGEDYVVDITYPTEANLETSIEIAFKDFIKYKEGDKIEITYSAILNPMAVIGNVGNPNTVNLEYSNNPNKHPEGEYKPGPDDTDVTGKTPDKETRTYVTGVELKKINDKGAVLEGAEFTIEGDKVNTVVTYTKVWASKEDEGASVDNKDWYKLLDGTYTNEAPKADELGTDGTVTVKGTADKYVGGMQAEAGKLVLVTTIDETTEHVSQTVTSGPDGVIRFDGLAAGTYTITETKAPNGYNQLKDPLTLEIVWTAPVAGETTCKWSVGAKSSPGFSVDMNGEVAVGNDFHTEVLNTVGSEMPSTGGIGTTIFYVLGGLMVAGAGILLVTKRRMGK